MYWQKHKQVSKSEWIIVIIQQFDYFFFSYMIFHCCQYIFFFFLQLIYKDGLMERWILLLFNYTVWYKWSQAPMKRKQSLFYVHILFFSHIWLQIYREYNIYWCHTVLKSTSHLKTLFTFNTHDLCIRCMYTLPRPTEADTHAYILWVEFHPV